MKALAVLLLWLLLAACAVAPRNDAYSLIDPRGVDMTKYQADYDDCANLANQTSVGERAAGGAVFGALLGAAIGGALCGRNCTKSAAGWGTAGGTGGGVAGGVREQQTALRACLAGRGYRVIR